jgi:hypothetical protein
MVAGSRIGPDFASAANAASISRVPPQDCEMRFAHRLHGMPYTHVGPGSLDPVRGTY